MLGISSGKETDLGWWYSTEEMSVYTKAIQRADLSKVVGWMAFSGNFTNVDDTMREITQALRNEGKDAEIAGRMRVFQGTKDIASLNEEHSRKGGLWINRPYNVLYIESEAKKAKRVAKRLLQLFNNIQKPQPGNLPFRFVPTKQYASFGRNSKNMVTQMKKKHEAVINKLEIIQCQDIIHMDKEVEGKTLQQEMMQMRHSVNSGLFDEFSG